MKIIRFYAKTSIHTERYLEFRALTPSCNVIPKGRVSARKKMKDDSWREKSVHISLSSAIIATTLSILSEGQLLSTPDRWRRLPDLTHCEDSYGRTASTRQYSSLSTCCNSTSRDARTERATANAGKPGGNGTRRNNHPTHSRSRCTSIPDHAGGGCFHHAGKRGEDCRSNEAAGRAT